MNNITNENQNIETCLDVKHEDESIVHLLNRKVLQIDDDARGKEIY